MAWKGPAEPCGDGARHHGPAPGAALRDGRLLGCHPGGGGSGVGVKVGAHIQVDLIHALADARDEGHHGGQRHHNCSAAQQQAPEVLRAVHAHQHHQHEEHRQQRQPPAARARQQRSQRPQRGSRQHQQAPKQGALVPEGHGIDAGEAAQQQGHVAPLDGIGVTRGPFHAQYADLPQGHEARARAAQRYAPQEDPRRGRIAHGEQQADRAQDEFHGPVELPGAPVQHGQEVPHHRHAQEQRDQQPGAVGLPVSDPARQKTQGAQDHEAGAIGIARAQPQGQPGHQNSGQGREEPWQLRLVKSHQDRNFLPQNAGIPLSIRS